MAYRLDPREGLGPSLGRAASEQLETALSKLAGEPSAEAVHTARKSLKKTRSLLRLARPGIGRDVAGRENGALRDAGLLLSGTRDADVMVATIDKLAERYAGHAPAAAFDEIRAAVEAHASERRGTGGVPAAEARAAIEAVRARVASWPLDDVGAEILLAGIRRGYERGREGWRRAAADPGPENVHEWRKRVKDLWYHQRLVAPAWPAVLEAQAEEAHVLSELLGDDHDLAVLRDHLLDGEIESAGDVAAVVELAERRSAELVAAGLRLGQRLYAERPKAHARRLGAYLDAWVAEAGSAG